MNVRKLAAGLVKLEVGDGTEQNDGYCVVNDSLTEEDGIQNGEFLWLY
jgi:hypothetical protein